MPCNFLVSSRMRQCGSVNPAVWTLDRRFPSLWKGHECDHSNRVDWRRLPGIAADAGAICDAALSANRAAAALSRDGTRRPRQDHRRVCRPGRARCLFLGMADGQYLQPPARRREARQDGALGSDGFRAGQSPGHDHRLCRSGRTAGRLPQPGRGLWAGRAGARCLAGGGAGAGFRRPLLGLPGGRPAHRQFRAARQDARHQARLLPAGRPQLEGRDAQGHHQGVPRLDQFRGGRPAHLPGRHAGGQTRGPGAVAPGRDVSAGGIRRHDEEHRLEQDSARPPHPRTVPRK